MRCKTCGSTNVQIRNAIVSIGGKPYIKEEYHCMACGALGDQDSVAMEFGLERDINVALKCNDTEKLRELKHLYRNIEWDSTQNAQISQNQKVLKDKPEYYHQVSSYSEKDFLIFGTRFHKCISFNKSIGIPYGITSIEMNAFFHCSHLCNIAIPNTVTSIGPYAFSGCNNLTSITIPNGVTSIADEVFRGCSSLKSITLPNCVTSIGKRAFSGCSSLTDITIPSGVTAIAEGAFSGCSSLKSITLPNGVISIREGTFSDCTNLATVKIPNSVIYIGEKAFDKCKALKSAQFEDPTGWSYEDKEISVSDLDNAQNAAINLINKYSNSPCEKDKIKNKDTLQAINKDVQAKKEAKNRAINQDCEEQNAKKKINQKFAIFMFLFLLIVISLIVVDILFLNSILTICLSILYVYLSWRE